MEDFSRRESKEVKSKSLKAGRRTYFFDLKETRNSEHYLVIAESKKKFDEEDGHFYYEKHKIFLPVKDLERFAECLDEMFQYAKENIPAEEFVVKSRNDAFASSQDNDSVEFEDLDFEK